MKNTAIVRPQPCREGTRGSQNNPPALLFFLHSVPCQHLPLTEPNHKPEGLWSLQDAVSQDPVLATDQCGGVNRGHLHSGRVVEGKSSVLLGHYHQVWRSDQCTLLQERSGKNCAPYQKLSNQGASIFLIFNDFVMITQVEFLLLGRNENIIHKMTCFNDHPFNSHALPTDTSLLINVGHMYAYLFIHLVYLL